MRRLYCELIRVLIMCLVFVLIVVIMLHPSLDDYQRSYFMKRDLLSSRGDSCIVLLGGSNVMYGYDSGMLSDSLGVSVINAGLTGPMGLEFMLDFVSRYLRSGDVLLLSPTYEYFFGDMSYGDVSLALLYCLDGGVRRDFSFNQYVGMLEGIAGLPGRGLQLLFKSGSVPVSEDHHFNIYGDHDSHWYLPGLPIVLPDLRFFREINRPFLDYYASSVRDLRNRGVMVLILPPPLASSSYEILSDHIDSVRIELRLRDLDYMLSPVEFVYPDSLFYDSCYHLQYAGVLERTHRVLSYLRPLVHP